MACIFAVVVGYRIEQVRRRKRQEVEYRPSVAENSYEVGFVN